MLTEQIYDVVAVGLGPFNLGLAALLEENTDKQALFLEKKEEFHWHPGMLIEGTILQVPFLADLVSLVDPCSEYSFLSYLKNRRRLYKFYFFEDYHIPRQEYSSYCRWVSEKLENCQFGADVHTVVLRDDELFEVTYMANGESRRILAENVVMGTGTSPVIPECVQQYREDESILHSSTYLQSKENLQNGSKIAVIGSGQSAGEIFLDLLQGDANSEYCWLTRSDGFFPMEYSKLGLEYFSPEYIDFFHKLSREERVKTVKSQDLLYKGISADTIAEIYNLLYHRSVENNPTHSKLFSHAEVVGVQRNDERSGYKWKVDVRHKKTGTKHVMECDSLVFATGYKSFLPDLLDGVSCYLTSTDLEELNIDRQYRLELSGKSKGSMFIQNGDLFTHGVAAPDLGLGVHRNSVIINALCGEDVLPVDEVNVFQSFEMPERF
ncbi:MAG: SidA/IucD/PvdA family monooxygenase [Lentisphaerales bacterium]|nr:SidA/IucD/PvdA family monooxygenase [Lentisphaerales bacterium]